MRTGSDEALAMEISNYSEFETLRDGRRLEVRALRSEDREAMLESVGRMSEQSRYYRFFAPKSAFTEKEIAYFMNVDFANHVALVAVLEEAGRPVIVGGGRYIVLKPGYAEVAFGVDDAHQGLGIASALMRHLVAIARASRLEALQAEVLAKNASMLKVFEKSRLALSTVSDQGVLHVTLRLQ
jgi:RimJ/RimL family protein N-acetyltransferase